MNAPATELRNGEPEGVRRFIGELQRSGFNGDIASDVGARTVFSTDNSIYEVRPDAVIFPRTIEDIAVAVKLAASGEPRIALTARGGGTGTNGQSLNRGVIVDVSRHMNRIIAVDREAMTAEVEPGVVLDELNAHLRDYGLFFPPDVSSGSRATIGGMVATDASGKGSRIYGKTSDYIERLDVVLADGSIAGVSAMDAPTVATRRAEPGLGGQALGTVVEVVERKRDLIDSVFPPMNRGLTGYNLKGVTRPDGAISLIPLLAGSEGTLAITGRIKLRLIRRPTCRALVVIRYTRFQAALEHVQRLVEAEPSAVEIIDDKIIDLARGDVVWTSVEATLGDGGDAAGLNFVEFVGMDQTEVHEGLKRLEMVLETDGNQSVIDWTLVEDEVVISHLWKLRAKAVGLLGRLDGRRQGVAFVEDCAVPPKNLPAFVSEFRAVLDRHGLAYGMFGHADVGCLHVRPALDMTDPPDADLIRAISDEVAALTRKYGGLLWGEHGRGFRGEFSPLFFGPELYAELLRIKAAFDPRGILNPGKLADPQGVDRIDRIPFRGTLDRRIDRERAVPFERATACNGNGLCFNWDAADPMCPSYKATRDRTQSPKGRAALLKEWIRRESAGEDAAEIERALDDSLATCLSCKACANQCPVQVDIPAMKARYLERRHRTLPRPSRDRILALMETLLPLGRALPGLANMLMNLAAAKKLAELSGLVDLPAFSSRATRGALKACRRYSPDAVAALTAEERSRAVILMEDGFTSSFDAEVTAAVCELLEALGYQPLLAAAMPNGKALHVRGMLQGFERAAERMRRRHAEMADTGLPIIGVEAVTNLMFAHEYRTDDFNVPALLSIEQFLAAEIREGRLAIQPSASERPYTLFLHCTEKTARPTTGADWAAVFRAFGLTAKIIPTGCCGMAGLFGHEREHQDMSARLFDLSWREPMAGTEPSRRLATGFSCRCQTHRFTGERPRHPAEVLLERTEWHPFPKRGKT